MNIAIIGYGKMGKEIERIAIARGINIVSIIDPNDKNANFREIDEKSMKDADVCIDFTRPDTVVDNLQRISKFRKNVVIGTTGWNDKLEEARKIAKQAKIGVIHASNFSIGVNIFFRIIGNAAKMMDKVKDYEVFGYEFHHSKKLDSPSGTAKTIEKILVNNITRISKVNFASVRAGSIPGTHVIGFDSSADTIELKHTARNREGFALGAVMAAEWIQDKKGFFDINDMMNEIIGDGKNV